MNSRQAIPSIPLSGIDPQLRQLLDSMRTALLTHGDTLSDVGDKVSGILKNGVTTGVDNGTGSDTPTIDNGPIPVITSDQVTAVGSPDKVIISWTDPRYSRVARYDVLRAPEAGQVGDAVVIGSTGSRVYADAIGANNAYRYWIRIVRAGDGATGQLDSTGALGSTKNDDAATAIMDIIRAQKIGANMIAVDSLAAISAILGSISGGSINIADKFIVEASGRVTMKDSTLQSGNFSPNAAGWRILQDGGSEFNSGLFRGDACFDGKIYASRQASPGELQSSLISVPVLVASNYVSAQYGVTGEIADCNFGEINTGTFKSKSISRLIKVTMMCRGGAAPNSNYQTTSITFKVYAMYNGMATWNFISSGSHSSGTSNNYNYVFNCDFVADGYNPVIIQINVEVSGGGGGEVSPWVVTSREVLMQTMQKKAISPWEDA